MQAAILKVTVFLPWCLAFPVPPATDLKGLDFVKVGVLTGPSYHIITIMDSSSIMCYI